MNLLDRIRNFFSKLLAGPEKNPQEQAKLFIRKQKMNQKRLKESMTELIFQRKKFETQLANMEDSKAQYEQDLELLASQNKDDLAIKVMEQLDLVNEELVMTQKNLQMIQGEIKTAKAAELDLARQVERSESQLAVLVSRSHSVKMQENLKVQFAEFRKELNSVKPEMNQIEESIMRLEAKLENIQGPQDQWKDEVLEMRRNRKDRARMDRLNALKKQMNTKQLPASVIIPEIVNQTH